ncbi:hypothetical protein IJU97_02815 [bacterium]|nr:hypothetical protein [bacterium]
MVTFTISFLAIIAVILVSFGIVLLCCGSYDKDLTCIISGVVVILVTIGFVFCYFQGWKLPIVIALWLLSIVILLVGNHFENEERHFKFGVLSSIVGYVLLISPFSLAYLEGYHTLMGVTAYAICIAGGINICTCKKEMFPILSLITFILFGLITFYLWSLLEIDGSIILSAGTIIPFTIYFITEEFSKKPIGRGSD